MKQQRQSNQWKNGDKMTCIQPAHHDNQETCCEKNVKKKPTSKQRVIKHYINADLCIWQLMKVQFNKVQVQNNSVKFNQKNIQKAAFQMQENPYRYRWNESEVHYVQNKVYYVQKQFT